MFGETFRFEIITVDSKTERPGWLQRWFCMAWCMHLLLRFSATGGQSVRFKRACGFRERPEDGMGTGRRRENRRFSVPSGSAPVSSVSREYPFHLVLLFHPGTLVSHGKSRGRASQADHAGSIPVARSTGSHRAPSLSGRRSCVRCDRTT